MLCFLLVSKFLIEYTCVCVCVALLCLKHDSVRCVGKQKESLEKGREKVLLNAIVVVNCYVARPMYVSITSFVSCLFVISWLCLEQYDMKTKGIG